MKNIKETFQKGVTDNYVLPIIISDRFLKSCLSAGILKSLRQAIKNKDLKSIVHNARILHILIKGSNEF